jgi:signal transduction histidine kinase
MLERDTGIEYSFVDRNGEDDYDIGDFAKLQLYRIVQEALNNVGKHSHASKCEVKLQTHLSNLEITVSDNGNGINPKLIRKDSHGLLNIRHRAQLIGATVEWKKADVFEHGTQVKVRMPLVTPEPTPEDTTVRIKPIEMQPQKGTEQA